MKRYSVVLPFVCAMLVAAVASAQDKGRVGLATSARMKSLYHLEVIPGFTWNFANELGLGLGLAGVLPSVFF